MVLPAAKQFEIKQGKSSLDDPRVPSRDLAKSRQEAEKALENIKHKEQEINQSIESNNKRVSENNKKIASIKEILEKDEKRRKVEGDIRDYQIYKELPDLDEKISNALSKEENALSKEEIVRYRLELAEKLMAHLERKISESEPEQAADRSEVSQFFGGIQIVERNIHEIMARKSKLEEDSEGVNELIKKGKELNIAVKSDNYGPLENSKDQGVELSLEVLNQTKEELMKCIEFESIKHEAEACGSYDNIYDSIHIMSTFMRSLDISENMDKKSKMALEAAYGAKALEDLVAKRKETMDTMLDLQPNLTSSLLKDVWNYHKQIFSREKLQNKYENYKPEFDQAHQLKVEFINSLNSGAGVELREEDPECRIGWEISKAKKMSKELKENNTQLEKEINHKQRELDRLHLERILLNPGKSAANESEQPPANELEESEGIVSKLMEGGIKAFYQMHHDDRENLPTHTIDSQTREIIKEEINKINNEIKELDSLENKLRKFKKDDKGKKDDRTYNELEKKREKINKWGEEVTRLLNDNIYSSLHACLDSASTPQELINSEPVKQMKMMIEIARDIADGIDEKKYQERIEDVEFLMNSHFNLYQQPKIEIDTSRSQEWYATLRKLQNTKINEAIDLAEKGFPQEAKMFEMIFRLKLCERIGYYKKDIAEKEGNTNNLHEYFENLNKVLKTRSCEGRSLLTVRISEEVSGILQDVWEEYQNECNTLEDNTKNSKYKEIVQKINEIADQPYTLEELTINKVKKALKETSSSLTDRKRQLQDYLQSSEQSDEPEDKTAQETQKFEKRVNGIMEGIQEEIKNLENERENFLQNLLEKKEQIESMEEIIKQERKKIDDLNKEIQNQKDIASRLDTSNKEKNKELGKLTNDLMKEKGSLEASNREKGNLIKEHTNRVNALNALLDKVKEEKQALEQQAAQQKEKYEQALKQQAAQLEKEHQGDLERQATQHRQTLEQQAAQHRQTLEQQAAQHQEALEQQKAQLEEQHRQALEEQAARYQEAYQDTIVRLITSYENVSEEDVRASLKASWETSSEAEVKKS